MKIPEFGSFQMTRTNEAHYGKSKIAPVDAVISQIENSAEASVEKTRRSFDSYLLEAVSTVNQQQLDVNALQEKIITNPDEVDIQDVAIAMSKARMSLNLAQTVIDRLVQGWSEITTTR